MLFPNILRKSILSKKTWNNFSPKQESDEPVKIEKVIPMTIGKGNFQNVIW